MPESNLVNVPDEVRSDSTLKVDLDLGPGDGGPRYVTVAAVAGVERARWIAMGLAFGAALGASAWIATTAIETDERYSTGGVGRGATTGAVAMSTTTVTVVS